MKQSSQQLKQLGVLLIQIKDQLRDFQLGNQVIDSTASGFDSPDERSGQWSGGEGSQTMGMMGKPEELIERMEEEIESKKSLVENLYPKDIHSLQKYILDLEEIERLSEVTPEILDKLNQRIENINHEINTMVEKRILIKSDSMDGNGSKQVNKMISLQRNVSFLSSLSLRFFFSFFPFFSFRFFSVRRISRGERNFQSIFLLNFNHVTKVMNGSFSIDTDS